MSSLRAPSAATHLRSRCIRRQFCLVARVAGALVVLGVASACNDPAEAGVKRGERPAPQSTSAAPQPSAVPAASRDVQPGAAEGAGAVTCPAAMVRIPGGQFLMGAPYSVKPGGDYFLHAVALRAFCLDEAEVSVAAYRQCVQRNDCEVPHANGFSCTYGQQDRENHPVNCLDWHQAQRACRGMGKRLPTEEEWEYAARGGSEQRVYSWGALTPSSELACYNHPGTCPVRSFAPGAFGLHDMTGNVWEWTASTFTKRAGWLPAGEWRVYRGGSYSRRFPKWMKTWVRNRFRPEEWGAHLGIRCALDLRDAACPQGTTPAEGTTQCQIPGEPPPRVTTPISTASATATGPVPAAEQLPPPTITRDPQFDEDCRRYKPGKPTGYLIKGSSFAQRQASKRDRGCTNRDVGPDFNSVCCP